MLSVVWLRLGSGQPDLTCQPRWRGPDGSNQMRVMHVSGNTNRGRDRAVTSLQFVMCRVLRDWWPGRIRREGTPSDQSHSFFFFFFFFLHSQPDITYARMTNWNDALGVAGVCWSRSLLSQGEGRATPGQTASLSQNLIFYPGNKRWRTQSWHLNVKQEWVHTKTCPFLSDMLEFARSHAFRNTPLEFFFFFFSNKVCLILDRLHQCVAFSRNSLVCRRNIFATVLCQAKRRLA